MEPLKYKDKVTYTDLDGTSLPATVLVAELRGELHFRRVNETGNEVDDYANVLGYLLDVGGAEVFAAEGVGKGFFAR